MAAVAKELAPMKQQIKILATSKKRILKELADLKKWSKEVFGNGSGYQGYLEKSREEVLGYLKEAREEDLEWKDTLLTRTTKLEADRLKQEGFEAGLKFKEEQVKELNQHKFDRRTLIIAAIAAAGTWAATNLPALLHSIFSH